MSRKRALSETGLALFSQSYVDEKCITKPSIGCLRSIFHKLFTTDYDIRLDDTSNNMKTSSSKVLSLLYSLKKIPEIHNNAISNLVALILSNGEKILSKQQVKYNIGFYLNLAKKAISANDHQTAILVKAAISNFNITRLKIKYNKKMKETIKLLDLKYGDFKSMHSKHIQDMIENKNNKNYFPSTMVLHMHLKKNRIYEKAYRRFGCKDLDKLNALNYELHEVQSIKYQDHKQTDYKLCPIYENDPLELEIASKIKDQTVKSKNMNTNEFLHTLSINVNK